MPRPLRTMGLSAPISVALDPEVWRRCYVHGIPLGPDLGSAGLLATAADVANAEAADALATKIDEMPADVIRWHLRTALSELSIKIGQPMGIVVVKSPPIDAGMYRGVHYDKLMPRRPYTRADAENWYRIQLHGPVISLERVRAYYYGNLVWEFSDKNQNIDLVRTAWETQGVNHILPINFQSMIVESSAGGGPSNYGVWHTLGAHRSPVQDFWAVDYTLGPVDKETGIPGQLEMALINWVMLVAGQTILGIAGMGRTGGISNQSISFDGLSRSIGLTASAQAGLYGALEGTFKAAEERLDWKLIRAYKRGPRVIPLGF